MATHDAIATPSAPATRVLQWPPENDIEGPREDFAPPAGATRDALYRRILAAADVIAAGTAFLFTISIVGSDKLGIWAVLAVAAVIPVCKLAGLYDRDEHLLQKTTLDEAPALFLVAALY